MIEILKVLWNKGDLQDLKAFACFFFFLESVKECSVTRKTMVSVKAFYFPYILNKYVKFECLMMIVYFCLAVINKTVL